VHVSEIFTLYHGDINAYLGYFGDEIHNHHRQSQQPKLIHADEARQNNHNGQLEDKSRRLRKETPRNGAHRAHVKRFGR
jgi:hypothetical protein